MLYVASRCCGAQSACDGSKNIAISISALRRCVAVICRFAIQPRGAIKPEKQPTTVCHNSNTASMQARENSPTPAPQKLLADASSSNQSNIRWDCGHTQQHAADFYHWCCHYHPRLGWLASSAQPSPAHSAYSLVTQQFYKDDTHVEAGMTVNATYRSCIARAIGCIGRLYSYQPRAYTPIFQDKYHRVDICLRAEAIYLLCWSAVAATCRQEHGRQTNETTCERSTK